MKLILKNSIKKSKYYTINSLFFTNKNHLEINYFYWFENKLYLKQSIGFCFKLHQKNLFPSF